MPFMDELLLTDAVISMATRFILPDIKNIDEETIFRTVENQSLVIVDKQTNEMQLS